MHLVTLFPIQEAFVSLRGPSTRPSIVEMSPAVEETPTPPQKLDSDNNEVEPEVEVEQRAGGGSEADRLLKQKILHAAATVGTYNPDATYRQFSSNLLYDE